MSNREERRASGDYEPQLGIEKDVAEFLSGQAPMTEALDAFLIRFERVQWFFIYGQIEQSALMLRTIAAQNEILIAQGETKSKLII